MPFTLRNLKADLDDVGPNFDGSPDLEFRLATQALELKQAGLSYQRIPPDYRFPYGHTHKKQEEVYVVLRGSGRSRNTRTDRISARISSQFSGNASVHGHRTSRACAA